MVGQALLSITIVKECREKETDQIAVSIGEVVAVCSFFWEEDFCVAPLGST